MKSAAVIGAGSMLGEELIRQLHASGVDTLRVGRGPDNDIILDLDAPPAFASSGLPHVDAVFHCAAAFADDSPSGLRTNALTNTLGCFGVLELLRRLQCGTCIYAGSISSTHGVEAQGRSGYGLSKELGEQVLAWGLSECRTDGLFCSIRMPQLYDVAGRCCRHQPWFGRIVGYASRGMDLNMPAPGGVRNFLHVRDAATLLIRAQHVALRGAWNASHPESMNYLQIAQCAYDVFAGGGKIIIDPGKAPFRPVAIPDGGPLFARLGTRPRIAVRQGLEMIHDAGSAGAFGPLDVT